MFPEAKGRGTLRDEGHQNSLFPMGPVILKYFVRPPNSKSEQTVQKLFDSGWHTNLLGFQGA